MAAHTLNRQLRCLGKAFGYRISSTNQNLSKSFSFDVVNGKDGINGKDGVNGKDGIGIDSLRIDDSGILSVRYSDGTSQSLGRVGAAPVIEVPGEIARYYFDVPYDDFSGISIGERQWIRSSTRRSPPETAPW